MLAVDCQWVSLSIFITVQKGSVSSRFSVGHVHHHGSDPVGVIIHYSNTAVANLDLTEMW